MTNNTQSSTSAQAQVGVSHLLSFKCPLPCSPLFQTDPPTHTHHASLLLLPAKTCGYIAVWLRANIHASVLSLCVGQGLTELRWLRLVLFPIAPDWALEWKSSREALIPDCREQFLFRKQSFLALSLACSLSCSISLFIALLSCSACHCLHLEPPLFRFRSPPSSRSLSSLSSPAKELKAGHLYWPACSHQGGGWDGQIERLWGWGRDR